MSDIDRSADQPLAPITARIADVCRATGIGRSKLYELIAAEEIATIKVGRITLIPVASVTAFLKRQSSG